MAIRFLGVGPDGPRGGTTMVEGVGRAGVGVECAALQHYFDEGILNTYLETLWSFHCTSKQLPKQLFRYIPEHFAETYNEMLGMFNCFLGEF